MSGLGCEKKKRQPYLLLDPHVLNGLLLLGDASSSLGHITLTPQYCPDKDTASGKSAEHLSSICTKSSNRKEEILVRTLERISPMSAAQDIRFASRCGKKTPRERIETN